MMNRSALSSGIQAGWNSVLGSNTPRTRVENFDTGSPQAHTSQWEQVIHVFQKALENSDVAVAHAAIKALTFVVETSTAATAMGLGKDLEEAAATLKRYNLTNISLAAGCEMFVRSMARIPFDDDFGTYKRRIVRGCKLCAEDWERARERIADLGFRFVNDDSTILVHGHSRCVLRLLKRARDAGRRFSVVVTEGRPDSAGIHMATSLRALDVPVTIVLDSGVAFVMERVSAVFVGAEGVVENGGVINKIGTYGVAIVAKAHNVPVYVAAENYKFARFYPLSQQDPDLPTELGHVDFGPLVPRGAQVENRSRDYTPPQYISLLITNLGVLTPAAVSDELIKLYNGEREGERGKPGVLRDAALVVGVVAAE